MVLTKKTVTSLIFLSGGKNSKIELFEYYLLQKLIN